MLGAAPVIARLKLKLAIGTLAAAALAASHWAMWQWGSARGVHQASADCQQAHIDGLVAVVQDIRLATTQANTASLAIGQWLSRRERADQLTTKELRDALHATRTDRVECVFDAGVMRLIAAAADRASEAAAGGLDGAVPARDDNGGE